jgi:uncharacterized protein YyaL (SSP411 family)
MTIEFLLRQFIRQSSRDDATPVHSPNQDDPILKPAIHALKAMSRGGMYDVVGGGFSRYSVDNFWRVTHFEKMLYDNAQLVRAYLHAWQITHDPFFKRVATETLDFIAREMTHPDGGFYSSLDADSEGVEGKFYVWTLDEIRATLKDDSTFFEAAYGITAQGNWEGNTVLQRTLDDESLAARFKLDPETVPAKLAESHSKLLSVRSTRIRPGTDDKILTSWNGLMLIAMAEAGRVLTNGHAVTSSHLTQNENPYHQLAVRNAEFILNSLRPDGKRTTVCSGRSRTSSCTSTAARRIGRSKTPSSRNIEPISRR